MRDMPVNIFSVVDRHLCHGCGVCAGVCTTSAIAMDRDDDHGVYVPIIDPNRCTGCGTCHTVCPGHQVSFTDLGNQFLGDSAADGSLGIVLECNLSHAKNEQHRYNGASGGVATTLLLSALKSGVIDCVLTTRMSKGNPLEPEVFIARTAEEILAAAGSKYCPVPLGAGLSEVAAGMEKVAVVGLACQIHGVRLAQKHLPGLQNKIIFCVGIYCGHTSTFLATQYVLSQNSISRKNVSSLAYRGMGWPGTMRVGLGPDDEFLMPYKTFIAYHEQYFFTPTRCLTCIDGVNRLSDITIMDAWLPELEKDGGDGESFIIIRSSIGQKIWSQALSTDLVTSHPCNTNDVWRSHGRHRLGNRDFQAQATMAKLWGHGVPQYDLTMPTPTITNWLRTLLMWWNASMTSHVGLVRSLGPIIEFQMILSRLIRRLGGCRKTTPPAG